MSDSYMLNLCDAKEIHAICPLKFYLKNTQKYKKEMSCLVMYAFIHCAFGEKTENYASPYQQ